MLCNSSCQHVGKRIELAYFCSGDGYGRGEGFAALVLRRSTGSASSAAALVVVRGSAVNQDGRSSGLTAPNGPSQAALVRCGPIQPDSVMYVYPKDSLAIEGASDK